MKKMMIAGNWKMNTNGFEAAKLAESLVTGIMGKKLNVDVVVCPPFINIAAISDLIKKSKIFLGAQNCHHLPSGAFTGETSIPMLEYYGCTHIIIGHSERRQYFGEDNLVVNTKIKAVLNSNLKVIMCIGESIHERQSGRTFDVFEKQLKEGLNNVDSSFAGQITIAYEPIWAIGTGVSADVQQVNEAHTFIRRVLIELFGEAGKEIKILYGGSVNQKNAVSILELDDVNGALVGAASLKTDSFLSIIKTAQEIIGG